MCIRLLQLASLPAIWHRLLLSALKQIRPLRGAVVEPELQTRAFHLGFAVARIEITQPIACHVDTIPIRINDGFDNLWVRMDVDSFRIELFFWHAIFLDCLFVNLDPQSGAVRHLLAPVHDLDRLLQQVVTVEVDARNRRPSCMRQD